MQSRLLLIFFVLTFVSASASSQQLNEYDGRIVEPAVVKLLGGGAKTFNSVLFAAGSDPKKTSNSFSKSLLQCAKEKKNLIVGGPDNTTNFRNLQSALALISDQNLSGCHIIFIGDERNFEELKTLTLGAGGEFHATTYPQKKPKEEPVITPGALSLIAGSIDGRGSSDGVGLQAQFGSAQSDIGINPKGITSDEAGNLYVADTPNHTIRKITPQGVVTTIAGQAGYPGSADGPGLAAQFKYPTGIIIDKKGALYITDSANFTVRKISPSGEVTTLAGTAGVSGWLDGEGKVARFGRPMGITVSAQGDVYVTDAANYCVRKITPKGNVTTLAGRPGKEEYVDAQGLNARFGFIKGIAIDNQGVLFVADDDNAAVRRVTQEGVVTSLKLIPTADNKGSFDMTETSRPDGVAIDNAGNLYLNSGHVMMKVNREGRVSVLAGQGDPWHTDGVGTLAQFHAPGNPTLDKAGNLYVTDDHLIRKITPQGKVTTIAGQAEKTGAINGIGSFARFSNPMSLALDKQGNLFVSDRGNGVVRKITTDGAVFTAAGVSGKDGIGYRDGAASSSKFHSTGEIVADTLGNLYLADMGNNVIRKINTLGKVTTIAGMAGQSGQIDGVSEEARFDSPYFLTIDSAGNLFIASKQTIRKIDKAGVVTTIAGKKQRIDGTKGGMDGQGLDARFNSIEGMAIDKDDNIFISDGEAIRKMSPSVAVTTWGHNADKFFNAIGDGYTYMPGSLAVDDQGNVYFAINQTIRKLTPNGVVTTVAGVANFTGTKLGRLGGLDEPRGLLMLGPKSMALISGNAILMLSLP
ncbi:hypothetical protein ACO0K9_19130 [Undibacterium sp. Ji50W]|uniref:NHL domain-containing protein n=1 Tax=Undibacterium sp. Ji50W TaxID=3413041 RepID=UPI003BF12549